MLHSKLHTSLQPLIIRLQPSNYQCYDFFFSFGHELPTLLLRRPRQFVVNGQSKKIENGERDDIEHQIDRCNGADCSGNS